MQTFGSWRWSALAIAFGIAASAARADMITPNSIPHTANAVGSANGTPVYANSYISRQYTGVGLNFTSGTAITNLNGAGVWAPIEGLGHPGSGVVGTQPWNYPVAQISYLNALQARIVTPGSLNPTTVSSLSVDIEGRMSTFPLPTVSVHVYGLNGQLLNITPSTGFILSDQVWTFTGPGISSFRISPSSSATVAWGVGGVFLPTATAPEPPSLLLAGLGALGIAFRRGWRRAGQVT